MTTAEMEEIKRYIRKAVYEALHGEMPNPHSDLPHGESKIAEQHDEDKPRHGWF